MSSLRGRFNSSITRVRPVFQSLLRADATGRSWIPILLRLATCNRKYADELATAPGTVAKNCTAVRNYADGILRHYGVSGIELEGCFEHSLPPPATFLSWLIRNPEQMTWPRTKGVRKTYGQPVQVLREKLFGKYGAREQEAAQRLALEELAQVGPIGSSRKWWAFEGFSNIDCYLETDRFVLLIEGKRTERLGPSTDWYPKRNQAVRNLEVAQLFASDKEFGVMLIAEDILGTFSEQTIVASLPHLQATERDRLLSHYFGCLTWQNVCQGTGISYDDLPIETKAVAAILRQRSVT